MNNKRVKIEGYDLPQIEAMDHYDYRAINLEDRNKSRLLTLRKIQNWIKAVLISQRSKSLQKDYLLKTQLLNVLDLGCGKGGDLNKWERAGTGIWIGMDISQESLKEALNRHQKSNRIKLVQLIQESGCVDPNQFESHFQEDIQFDIINMQFMANVMINSEKTLENTLEVFFIIMNFKNISKRLVKGGEVLLTITDATVILSKIDDEQYQNQYFSIKKDDKITNEMVWGKQYLFYLEDAVGFKEKGQITYVPEYLIEMNSFKSKANDYNLEVTLDLNFLEFIVKYKDEEGYLFKKMVGEDYKSLNLPQEFWDIIQLYRVVVLKHTQGIEGNKIKRYPQIQLTGLTKFQQKQ